MSDRTETQRESIHNNSRKALATRLPASPKLTCTTTAEPIASRFTTCQYPQSTIASFWTMQALVVTVESAALAD